MLRCFRRSHVIGVSSLVGLGRFLVGLHSIIGRCWFVFVGMCVCAGCVLSVCLNRLLLFVVACCGSVVDLF